MTDTAFTQCFIEFTRNILKNEFYNQEFGIYKIITRQERDRYIHYFNLYEKAQINKHNKFGECLGIYFVPPFIFIAIALGFAVYHYYEAFYFPGLNDIGKVFSITAMPEKQYLVKGYFLILTVLYSVLTLILIRPYLVIVKHFDTWQNAFCYYADVLLMLFVIFILLLAAPLADVMSQRSSFDFTRSPAGTIAYFCLVFFMIYFLLYRLTAFSTVFLRKSKMDDIENAVAASYDFYIAVKARD